MIKVCCDRCGKDITTNHKYKIHVEYKHSITPGKVYAVPPKKFTEYEMDLCTECHDDFKKFIEKEV